MPWSPLVMAYLMWLDVVYTNTPLSSHVPDFTLKWEMIIGMICGSPNVVVSLAGGVPNYKFLQRIFYKELNHIVFQYYTVSSICPTS